ncbi:transcriptional regulator with XRE-family HTH domain [Allocatelliglobosispora scoriae]|uniref:Transcriptional regulator with XRE-family HTH domain n=1 Tax=Allocatelliglobosispora scoriae TaxID=643052 RepID=A0A841BR73_9ACTN|nr:helix-turn-helix transcriptional regulator [Allocatelliglobosispora scoriae]MBB5869413.1 transcriptional regulator with XRE-family HTH domain [Allocatelliglobosispora scoriae]
MPSSADLPDETIDTLLTLLRQSRGLSQLRLAELLCAASGTPTLSRHEISRWERGERVPGPHWLSWLAIVLEVPPEVLERSARISRWVRHAPPEPRFVWGEIAPGVRGRRLADKPLTASG